MVLIARCNAAHTYTKPSKKKKEAENIVGQSVHHTTAHIRAQEQRKYSCAYSTTPNSKHKESDDFITNDG